jgi:sodium-dependent dicarboxylate transporter 2/3/5
MSHEIDIDQEGRLVLRIHWKPVVKVLTVMALAIGAGFLPLQGLTTASRMCLMIFVGAAGFWVTEAIPPFATAIMVIVMSVYMLGGNGGGPAADSVTYYRVFLNPIASPILVLFFGGFILAVAATKHGLDVRLARAFIKPFGTHPKMVLLGVIMITALFSMFMSNTATTAMMIAILGPLFKEFKDRDPLKKALVLAVPFAANIGGMGTIIGTPPNAVAASVLGTLGYRVSFIKWMVVAIPIMVIMLIFLWFLLIKIFKPRTDHFEILFPEQLKLTWDLVIVVLTFAVTVFLWLTEQLFRIPAAVAAMLPVMVFTMFGIIDREDLKKIEWHVLILIAGGLTLGVAMKESGLSDVLVGGISRIPVSAAMLLVIMSAFAVVISNFMSNTAAANLLIPIVVSISTLSPFIGALTVAFASSLAMSLPISTPPNAIAFATEVVETRDMARYGSLISIVGLCVMLLLVYVICVAFGGGYFHIR